MAAGAGGPLGQGHVGSTLGATENGPQQVALTGSLPVCGGCPRWGDVRIPEHVQNAETEAPSLGHLTRQGLPLVISSEPTAQGTSQAPRCEGPVSGGGLGSGLKERGAGGVDLRSQRHRRGHRCGRRGAQARRGLCRDLLCASGTRHSPRSGSVRGERKESTRIGGDNQGEARPCCDERRKREASPVVLRGSPSCCPAPGPTSPGGSRPGALCARGAGQSLGWRAETREEGRAGPWEATEAPTTAMRTEPGEPGTGWVFIHCLSLFVFVYFLLRPETT